MFVKIWVLIESRDSVLRTGLGGAGPGASIYIQIFHCQCQRLAGGVQEERWLD